MQVRDWKFDFKGIFSNSRLGYEFSSAMAEKEQELFARFKNWETIYAPLFGTIFNDFLEKVPVVELFDD